MKHRMILFTKAPRIDFGKSRLREFYSPEDRLMLSQKLIRKNIEILQHSNVDFCIYYTGRLSDLDFVSCEKKEQEGDSLGDRMYHAFENELKTADKVLIIGGDLADFHPDIPEEAFSVLDTADAVFAPAEDGGYGLIGLKEAKEEIRHVVYSTPNVLTDTLTLFKKNDISFGLTGRLLDIDTPEDLMRWEMKDESIRMIENWKEYALFEGDNRCYYVEKGTSDLREKISNEIINVQEVGELLTYPVLICKK